MRNSIQTFGLIISVITATFFSGFAAEFGAVAGGLQNGGFGWQFMPPLFCGWCAGFLLSVLSLVITRKRNYAVAFQVTLISPMAVAFLGAFIVYFALFLPERYANRQYARQYKQVRDEIRTNPDGLHELLLDARRRPLSDAERMAIWDRVWVKGAIPDKDILLLLDLFEHDGSALGGIIENQNITTEQLRYLYEKHKNAIGNSRILDDLSKDPRTPRDVLEALATEQSPTVSAQARKRLSSP